MWNYMCTCQYLIHEAPKRALCSDSLTSQNNILHHHCHHHLVPQTLSKSLRTMKSTWIEVGSNDKQWIMIMAWESIWSNEYNAKIQPRFQKLQILLHRWKLHCLNKLLWRERTISVIVHQTKEFLAKICCAATPLQSHRYYIKCYTPEI